MLDIYWWGTPNGLKISIALEELGLKYNLHKVELPKGEQKSPAYLAINPNGKIPALIDGDVKLFESVAMLVYLAEKHGGLLPKSEKGKYEAITWSVFQAATLGPMMGQFGHFKSQADPQPFATERFRIEVQKALNVLNDQLAKNSYVAGSEYTIADIAIWPWIRSFKMRQQDQIEESTFPHIARWFAEVEKRPGVQKGIQV